MGGGDGHIRPSGNREIQMKQFTVLILTISLLSGCASMRARNMTDEQIKDRQAILKGIGYASGVAYAASLDDRAKEVETAGKLLQMADLLRQESPLPPSSEAIVIALVSATEGDMKLAAQAAVELLAAGAKDVEARAWLFWFVAGACNGVTDYAAKEPRT